MPVIQTNKWVCEVCGKEVLDTKETFPYSDPVVIPPGEVEWKYVGKIPNEKLACPDCQNKLAERK